MVDRLQRALAHVDELPVTVQEVIAEQIETIIMPPDPVTVPHDFAGIWSDLQDDDEFAALERMRHEVPPTPPIEDEV